MAGIQVVYVPDAEGEYDVFVKFDDANIPKSPFKVSAVKVIRKFF